MPSRCYGCSLALRGSHLETLDFFLRVSRVELHDDGQDFLGHLCQSQVPVVPESPGVSLPGDSAPGLPIRSFSCVDIGIVGSLVCVNNNNQQQPTTTNNNQQQPTTTNQQPTNNQPTTNQQPTTNNQQPTTNNQQPTTNNQQPTTNNQQPTTNNQQPTTNNQQHTNNTRQQPPQPQPPQDTTSQGCPSLCSHSLWFCSAVAMDGERDGATSARHRRERRLRSWWRYEQQSVRMALNAAGWRGELRPTGTDDVQGRAARRPEGAGAAGRGSHGRVCGCPDTVAGRAAGGWRVKSWTPPHSASSQRRFEAKRKEEQEEQEKVFEELNVLFRIPVGQLTPLQQRRLAEHRQSGAGEAWRAAVWENRRKVVVRKRKKRLPKTSSHLSRGRARR